MHIDILGIVEEAIHIKSWKIPWVFRKEEGERNFNSSLSFFLKKMIFAVFSPFMLSSAALFLVFLAWLPTYGVHFFLHAHFILNLVPLCTQFSLRATTLPKLEDRSEREGERKSPSLWP